MGERFNPETVEKVAMTIPSELYEMKLVQLAAALMELLENQEPKAEDGPAIASQETPQEAA
jgi:hypothetical protein